MSLKKQTLWSMLPLLCITIVNLASVRVFYSSLGPEMYALWAYVLTFAGSFGFADLGLGVVVGRYVGVALGAGDKPGARQYWGTGNALVIPLILAMSIVFAAVGAIFGPKWFAVQPAEAALLRWSFIGGGAGLFLSYYGQFWLILSQVHLDFKFLGIMRSVTTVLGVGVAMLVAVATHNPAYIIWWNAAMAGFQLLFLVQHAWKNYGLLFDLAHARKARIREMTGLTVKTFATLVVNSLLGTTDRLLLGKIAPGAAFAHYTIAGNVGARIQSVSGAVMGPVFHNTNRALGSGDTTGAAAVFDEFFAFTIPWYFLACSWVAVWSPPALKLWLGADLAAAVTPIFLPVIIAYSLSAISNISASQLPALNRVGTGIFTHIAVGALLVVGTVLGWKLFGLPGVAWGLVLSRAPLVFQDIYVARIIGAGGWLAPHTARQAALFTAAALVFYGVSLLQPRWSLWQLIPAALHGSAAGLWIVRAPLAKALSRLRPAPGATHT